MRKLERILFGSPALLPGGLLGTPITLILIYGYGFYCFIVETYQYYRPSSVKERRENRENFYEKYPDIDKYLKRTKK